jgi:hypothetical protein
MNLHKKASFFIVPLRPFRKPPKNGNFAEHRGVLYDRFKVNRTNIYLNK